MGTDHSGSITSEVLHVLPCNEQTSATDKTCCGEPFVRSYGVLKSTGKETLLPESGDVVGGRAEPDVIDQRWGIHLSEAPSLSIVNDRPKNSHSSRDNDPARA